MDARKKRTVEILWTGGFDSTFRVVQLSRLDITIQPYYISDHRPSEEYELRAIQKITSLLKANSNSKASIQSVIKLDQITQIEKGKQEAFDEILKDDFFGSQYVWLSMFSKEHPGIELSIHEDDKAVSIINKRGKLKPERDDTIGQYWIIDPSQSEESIIELFGNFHFPLVQWTKLQMKKYYLENGYKDVMNATWFCHSPRKGKPCGTCNPCIYTIEEGMKERLGIVALARYYYHKMKNK